MGGVIIRKRFPIRAFAVALVAIALLGFGANANAVEESTPSREEITMSPSTKEHEVEPGETIRDSVTIINGGPSAYRYKMYAQPYFVNSDYDPIYSEDVERATAGNWVTFDIEEGVLAAGESQKINYTLTVPENAGVGGNYGVIFAETQPDEDSDEQIVRKKRVGSVLRVRVDGDIKLEGAFGTINLPRVQFRPPLVSEVDVQNSGNVDFDALSYVRVTDLFGNEKYKYERSSVVYPDTTRTINMNWDGAAWLGIYRVETSVRYSNMSEDKTRYVLMVPQWLIFVLVMFGVGAATLRFARRS